MINIGCDNPTGLSYCYFSIDALGFVLYLNLLSNNRCRPIAIGIMLLRRAAVTVKNGVSDKAPTLVWHLHKFFHSLVL